jgi:2-polyprenyl-6-methoxyphenol hydroxylase-like FAD-dependent oxidoreductase
MLPAWLTVVLLPVMQKRVVKVEVDGGAVEAVPFDLLVAADGAFSKVRSWANFCRLRCCQASLYCCQAPKRLGERLLCSRLSRPTV